jgi:gliding motility-associated-like protein
MEKIKLIVFLFLTYITCSAQEALQNFGALKIHDTGGIGFHSNLINNGVFDDNSGIAGFYNDDELTISGAFIPTFNDIEVVVSNNLNLNIGVAVTNNSNFILGNINTPKDQLDITLNYTDAAFYIGETEITKVDGYASITNKSGFIFPVGNQNKFRPATILSTEINAIGKCAYFYENPNTPSTFNTFFNTENSSIDVLGVSNYEFWDLDSEIPSTINLTWDEESEINSITPQLENLTVVGWSIENQTWESLGNIGYSGDFTSGNITSDTFVPNDYEIITFGQGIKSDTANTDNLNLDNFILTPNGDGLNDYFIIDAVELSPNNTLQVFNRWGRVVYEKENYQNTFEGTSNNSFTVLADIKLPDGVYFYIINLYDIEFKHQGFLYIDN